MLKADADRIRALAPMQRAIEIDKLMKKEGWNQREVGEVLGLPQRQILSCLKYLKLCPEARALLSEELPETERLQQESAYHLSKVTPETQRELLRNFKPMENGKQQLKRMLDRRISAPIFKNPEMSAFKPSMKPAAVAQAKPPVPKKKLIKPPPFVPPPAKRKPKPEKPRGFIVDGSHSAAAIRKFVDVPEDEALQKALAKEARLEQKDRTLPFAEPPKRKAEWSGIKRTDFTVEYYDERSFRFVSDSVEMWKYRQLHQKGLLKFQKEGKPRPESYPDPEV